MIDTVKQSIVRLENEIFSDLYFMTKDMMVTLQIVTVLNDVTLYLDRIRAK